MPTVFKLVAPAKTISSVIKSPAIAAVMNGTKQPQTKDLNATLVKSDRREGANALKAPIIIPNDDGFANPQIAYVVIAADRS